MFKKEKSEVTVTNLKLSCYFQLQQFLDNDKMKIKWLEDDIMKVYVRKSTRLIESKMVNCLDIATVEVEEEYQNKGIFSTFLGLAEQLNPYDYLYIENVMTDRFCKKFENENWTKIGNILPICFYKRKN